VGWGEGEGGRYRQPCDRTIWPGPETAAVQVLRNSKSGGSFKLVQQVFPMKNQFQRARENGGHGPPPVGAGPPLHGARGFPLAPAFAWFAHGHLGGFGGPVPPCFLPLTARQASLGSYFLLSCCAPLAASLTHLAIIVSIFLCFFQRQVSVGCQLR